MCTKQPDGSYAWKGMPAIKPRTKAARAEAAKHVSLVLAIREGHCYVVEAKQGVLPEDWRFPRAFATLAQAVRMPRGAGKRKVAEDLRACGLS
eukprot:11281257-Alexandrium_andersonii.AAC.1